MLEWMREELVEARFLRSVYSVNHRSAKELSRMMYACMLALEILRYENPDAATRYAQQTVWGGEYEKLRPGATDMYNLMCILSNQADYQDLIKTDYDISPGLLETTAYIRRVFYGVKSTPQDRFVLINVGKLLDIETADLVFVRRVASYWPSSTVYERKSAIRALISNIQRLAPTLDIFGYLREIEV